ncbi:molybdopterin converting factor subunit 1 [Bacillus pseudomycoides]|uniref:Molybdopterin synthase sulfur carrier subunit n=1 Tax=Bacillus pseudomycoides TaxID=64104 RepID=A0A2B6RTC2_9BACI|nr:molybdopterin converting factor subunit 1 [Bacillus pseudomycoides]PEA84320.1 molybdopterin converting factor subunit 1 [Bacillus pseudomycoides]PED06434.1 molybdopterin converting factor subunit 1 [Bacillus pseudomycoides]PED72445.1 molybdopterin converting factor subunit 1 [Bacillus pseudomycoides]PEI41850.1 molybdopterin converting factor subunit 1 [Bacillus pseudomycoides]PEI93345.1 molybdopterin converting factor subunit 1 [Bacillus pseudomycoides]
MITMLLFANLREEVGSDQLLIIEKKEIRVHQLKEWLKDSYRLQSLDQVLTAINEEFAIDEDIVKDGDTVAFIPPVSGG